MERRIGDPAIKQGFKAIVADAHDPKQLDAIAAATQDIIAYYYDMMCAMALRRARPGKEHPYPDMYAMRRAVTEINRACANQQKDYLFKGTITNPADLFAFASGIAMPAA